MRIASRWSVGSFLTTSMCFFNCCLISSTNLSTASRKTNSGTPLMNSSLTIFRTSLTLTFTRSRCLVFSLLRCHFVVSRLPRLRHHLRDLSGQRSHSVGDDCTHSVIRFVIELARFLVIVSVHQSHCQVELEGTLERSVEVAYRLNDSFVTQRIVDQSLLLNRRRDRDFSDQLSQLRDADSHHSFSSTNFLLCCAMTFMRSFFKSTAMSVRSDM